MSRSRRALSALVGALAAAVLAGGAAPALAGDSGELVFGELPQPATEAPHGAASAIEIDRDAGGERYVAGQLLVTYEGSASGAQIGALNAAVGAETETRLGAIDARVLELSGVGSLGSEAARESALERARSALEASWEVESAGLNYVMRPAASFNDPLLGAQWGFPRVGLPAAWDANVGAGTRIAILDSGLDPGHPEFAAGKVIAYGEYWSLTPDGIPEDNTGHGTHVAGIASANTNNGEGVAGSSPASGLVIAKVCDEVIDCNTAQTANALIDAVNLPGGIDVLNMSLGSFNSTQVLADAVNFAGQSGVVVVAAAGNEARGNPFYPAAYPSAIAVASTNISDGASDFSNFGDWVDIAAPGGHEDNIADEDILSTYPALFGSYAYLDGTSMSSPLVAGTAALLAGQGRGASEIRSALEASATDLGSCGKDPIFGAGRLDAAAALGVSSPQANCLPVTGSSPDTCADAKLGLKQAKKKLAAARDSGDRQKIKRARKAVRKWKKRVRKLCGSG